ncbi:CPBP family intramembrane glutamic endopeptidase [Natranaerofaba carboxydovora]|uniref:CPBP family intramembrane glutamic endopeptidase n=1 Tax=Natranaerofaba carboxydovora TaxID=2742683 RepID=UPI001F13240E|nr:type II CAAX endopeptidase family protein [Natranaerofaba carboxydovora]UMZ73746.1 CAAX protease self-immunity [Natranaerofaba carboxydovora]
MKLVKHYPIVSFFVLAYLISWTFWLPFIFSSTSIFWLLGGFGPLIAAVLVVFNNEGKSQAKQFIKGIFRLKVALGWYFFALILPIIIYYFAYQMYLFRGGTVEDFVTPSIFFYPIALIFATLFGGGQEEVGWRGFALPRLQSKYSPFTSSVILGVMWAFWHIPLFYASATYQANFPFGWYLLNTIFLSIIFTWFFNSTGGSIFIAMLLHGAVNAPSGWVPLELMSSYSYMTLSTFFVSVILIIVTKNKPLSGTNNRNLGYDKLK